ncbi:MAG: transcriptional regulator [Pseudomonadota bacterium]
MTHSEQTPDEKRLIQPDEVRNRLGGISPSTLDRMVRDPRSNFPKPYRIGRLRFWRQGELDAWVDQQQEAEA